MNKNLISQLVVSICAILLIATVTFAWFAISNTADAGFVAQVGDLESTFEFASVYDGQVNVSPEGNELLDMKDVIPGQKFFFIMNIQSQGEEDGTVSIMLNDIISYNVKYTGDGTNYRLVPEYSDDNRYSKIQYAFRYSVTGAFWVPHGTQLSDELSHLDQQHPLDLIPKDWIHFSEEEMEDYYPKYDEPKTDNDEGGVRFNHLEEGTTNDKDDYILIKNVLLEGNLPTKNKKAFVIIFEIEFTSEPSLPKNDQGYVVTLPDNYDSKYSNIYELQLFSISNISIVTSKENE